MEDPYLLSFLHDIRNFIYLLLSGVEFIFGLSYLCGKSIVSGIISGTILLWSCICNLADGLQAAFHLFIEFETNVIRGVFLLYYIICKIVEAFQITFLDLIAFIQHVVVSVSQMIYDGIFFAFESISIIGVVPVQLKEALTILGDFTLNSFYNIGYFTYNFGVQLILSPINVIVFASQLAYNLLIIFPAKLLYYLFHTPISFYVGLVVLVSFYVFYCKFNLFTFFRCSYDLARWVISSTKRGFNRVGTFVYFQSQQQQKPVRRGRGRPRKSDSSSSSRSRSSDGDLKGLCVVCQESRSSYLAMPCSHVCLCNTCVHRLVEVDSKCPICRQRVTQYQRVFIP